LEIDDSITKNKLTDYRAHYETDADAIDDPHALEPSRYHSEKRRLETLLRSLPLRDGIRVLDVGCGSGWFAKACAETGATVWASDLSRRGVRGARDRYPAAGLFQVGDVYHMAFADSSFDIVLLSEVLEHLEDIDRALAEVVRVLRPGGQLLASVPYRENIVRHLCVHCNQFTPANAHLHRFDEHGLGDLLRRSGLEPQRQILLNNKLLELTRFPLRSAWMPHALWRAFDRFCNMAIGRPGFLSILAVKPKQ
jgi:SAM-dependent methyltransferase